MLTKVLAGSYLAIALLFTGAGAADEKPKDCCAAKLACCKEKSACCVADARLACCEKGLKCCAENKGCCAAVQKCCTEGLACCKEAKACCGSTKKATGAASCCTAAQKCCEAGEAGAARARRQSSHHPGPSSAKRSTFRARHQNQAPPRPIERETMNPMHRFAFGTNTKQRRGPPSAKRCIDSSFRAHARRKDRLA